MNRRVIKREVDYQIINEWIRPKDNILDLGCGKGNLLEKLKRERGTYGVGVDNDPDKVLSCIKRGVSVFQGDILELLNEFQSHSFDWVICSRTLHELSEPARIIQKALRIGRRVAIGFVNYGFWQNRLSLLLRGRQVRNEVYPKPWQQRATSNPVSIHEFETFCREAGITIHRAIYLDHTWQKPCRFCPQLFSGYVLYELSHPT